MTQEYGPPRYAQVASEIKRRVERGTYAPGSLLPSEYHLAGEFGVTAYEALLSHGAFAMSANELRLSQSGVEWFRRLGIDTDAAARQRRTFCRPCMDWSERRHHLAGSLGAALLSRIHALGWATRDKNSRVISFTPRGLRAFRDLFKTSFRHRPSG